jgi:uncharacterized membrane protein
MITLILPLATRLVGERFAKLASWAIVALLALLALWLAYLWAYDNGRDDERARWEAAAAKIEAADTKADAAATVKAAETKGQVDAQNDAAREAARGADDKLRAGLDRLRAEGAGKGGKAAK